MTATLKKQVQRNIHDLISQGSLVTVIDRTTNAKIGTMEVTQVSRVEITGVIQNSNPRYPGTPARFRVPELTQRGGNGRIDLDVA
jgi:hypothetical protein